MKVVLQRVSSASVTFNDAEKSSINRGLLILLGIEHEDAIKDIEWLCNKIVNMRIFSDENGLMNKSLLDISGEVLIVSQFTLHANTKKGNRPSFIQAAKPAIAIPLYEAFVARLDQLVETETKTGEFGANMQITLCNSNPHSLDKESR